MIKDGRNPDLPPNHPINALSNWRKAGILASLCYCTFLNIFVVTIILGALYPMAKDFHKTPGDIANSVGYMFLGMAVGCLLWNPLSQTAGRRPVYLLGSVLLLPCGVWMALSPSYGSFVAARVITGLFNSWSQTVPASTITDIYVESVLGTKMVLYIVFIVIAPAIAPIVSAGITQTKRWPVLFWLVLGMYGLQFIMFFFLVPETMWNEDDNDQIADSISDGEKAGAVTTHIEGNGHVGAAYWPWQRPGEYLSVFLSTIIMFKYLVIFLVSFFYGSTFAWSVGISVVLPQVYAAPPYNFSPLATGAAFLAFGIGGVFGIPLGGILADKCMSHMTKKTGSREPEHRLWALIPMLPLFFVSCVIAGCALKYHLHWIAFLFGGGIMFCSMTAITGVFATYVIECYFTKAVDTQAVFTFWRLMWAFAAAFFVAQWGFERGWMEEFMVQGALTLGLGLILSFGLIWKGKQLRLWQKMPLCPGEAAL
ncbi:hypothetical protein VHUM_03644 [Vanrija humicola]|uniref:Major facilitator superfamily (MFS) profile domain-containing protein n=1 Tax=Vanrija humicola TaxID=5417 RepID=A0A7D8V024_VANHU|nr:hypothetical protein VHUM_03644 [Vanrija humicola]